MTNDERNAAIYSMRRAAVERYAREHPEWVESKRIADEDRVAFARSAPASSEERSIPEIFYSGGGPYERAHPDGSFKAIAQKFGISVERARQIYARESHQYRPVGSRV